MASLRGEITVERDGRSWRLVLDFNAFVYAEELLAPEPGADGVAPAGPSYGDLCRAFAAGDLSARQARALVWAAALRHQPDTSLLDAGDLLSGDVGLLSRLFAAASPTPAEQEQLGN